MTSVTFDGLSSNFSMARYLGCDFSNVYKLKTFFPNPVNGTPILVILDPAHMLKLVRGTLGSLKIMLDSENGKNEILWQYFAELYRTQERELLHSGNKLTDLHINYKKKPMNVRLAAQLFSKSVADSMQHLLNIKNENFKNCEATIKFIRKFNDLFDLLNSVRFNKLYPWKNPISEKNFCTIYKEFLNCYEYMKDLMVLGDWVFASVLKSRKKAWFLGLLISIHTFFFIRTS